MNQKIIVSTDTKSELQKIWEKHEIVLIKTLGEVIKKHRLALNKSMYLISAECGMSKSTWREAELGVCKDINLSTIWKIADVLEISPSELLKEVEKKLSENFSLSE